MYFILLLPLVLADDLAAKNNQAKVAAESLRKGTAKAKVDSNDAGADLEETAQALEATGAENEAVEHGVTQVNDNADHLLDELSIDQRIAQQNAKAYDATATNLNSETLEDGKSINPEANNMAAKLNDQKTTAKELDSEAEAAIDKLYAVSTNAENTVEAHREVLTQLELGIDRMASWTGQASHSINALSTIITALAAAVNTAETEMLMITQTLTVLTEKLEGNGASFQDKIEDITMQRVGKVEEQQRAEAEEAKEAAS